MKFSEYLQSDRMAPFFCATLWKALKRVQTHAVLLLSVNIGVIVIVWKCTYWPGYLDLWPFSPQTIVFLGSL